MANFPVFSKNFMDIINREGRPLILSINYSGVPVSSTTLTSIGTDSDIGYGNGFYCSSLQVSLSGWYPTGSTFGGLTIQVRVDEYDDGDSFNAIYQIFRNKLVNGQTVSVDVNLYMRDFSTVKVFAADNQSGVPAKIDVNLVGVKITDSANIDGNNVVMWVGDSITKISGIPQNSDIPKYLLHTHATNDFLIQNGKDTRLTVVAEGGTTSSDGESARKRGWFDYAGKASYYFYAFGMNDASTGATQFSAYSGNVSSFVDWAQVKNPSSKVIILGINPCSNDTRNTNANILRTSASNYVTNLGNPNVFYCDMSNAFDRTNEGYYSTSDSAGDRVHPNLSGMTAMTEVIKTFLQTNNIV